MPESICSDDLPKYIQNFFTHLKGVRDASDATVAAYAHDIDMYLEYLASRPDQPSDEFVINDRTMRGFATFLRARNNVSSTIQRRLDGVSAFWKYLHLDHGFSEPKSVKDCGIRLKNKRNPTNSISRKEYTLLMEAIYVDLGNIQ